VNADAAWESHFKNAIGTEYKSEDEFSYSLFDGLRGSLTGFCHAPVPNPNPQSKKPPKIRLLGCNVGFDTKFYRRASLGLPDGYGISTESVLDHACVVFRYQGDEDENEDRKRGSKKHKGSDKVGSVETITAANQYSDVTAGVELKHEYSSCANHDGTALLDLRLAHGPIVQALVYTMDTWHYLTRRGISARELPVIVLACRLKKKEKSAKKLCCMQAHLKIPQVLRDPFVFQVDRCIPFSEANDKQAIAIYLDTMTIGLNHARAIENSGRVPRTLCCSTDLEDLELLASPIPDASSLGKFAINQGELFRYIGEGQLVKDWIQALAGRSRRRGPHFCFDESRKMDFCLVKISCKTVHNTLIPLRDCYDALSTLEQLLETSSDRNNVFSPLLASALIANRCLVTVMEDLSSSYIAVPFVAVTERAALWKLFQDLVNKVLLPLAELDIVHSDIRCVPFSQITGTYCIYNILYGVNSSTGLKLIDYDSFVPISSLCTFFASCAVSRSCLHSSCKDSAVEFLFWQVIWMAFVWSPASDIEVAVDFFCNKLFVETIGMGGGNYTALNDFKTWIGANRLPALEQMMQDVARGSNTSSSSQNVVGDALHTIMEAFGQQTVPRRTRY
jgi:hypothetical protein